MSNTIRRYRTIPHHIQYGAEDMAITATVQGKFGSGVQFTIGGKFCVMAENQVKELVRSLKKVLAGAKGYSATDWGEEEVIEPKMTKHTEVSK